MSVKPLILVAEDNPAVRKMLVMVLTRSGYDVMEADNGRRAVELTAQRRPDLLLLDIRMPEVDGIDALQQIRSLPGLEHVPAVMLTAVARRNEVVAAARAGACDYIVKSSFDIKAFLARIRTMLSPKAAEGTSVPAGPTPPMPTADRQSESAAVPAGPIGPPPVPEPVLRHKAKACLLRDAGNMPELAGHVPPLSDLELADHIRRITQVKALPFILPHVLALTESQHSSAAQLVSVIERDVALAGKVLAMANSSLYRRGRVPVTNIAQAVRNIGFGSVRQAALGLGLMDLFAAKREQGGINPLGFWEHSLASGMIARMLALRGGMNESRAFIVGMLHNLGQLIHDEFFGQAYSRMLGWLDSDMLLPADLEQRWMGLEHYRLAKIVMGEWHMPAELHEPIGEQWMGLSSLMSRPPDQRRWAALVRIADHLATCLGRGDGRPELLAHLADELVDDFAIDDEFLTDIRDSVPVQLQELKLMVLVYSPSTRWPEPRCRVSDQPLAYLCPRPPHLDIMEYYLRLRHRHFQMFTSPEAFCLRLDQGEAAPTAVVNLLPESAAKQAVAVLDRWASQSPKASSINGMVLARPEQAGQLLGPFGHAFRGLLEPVAVRQLNRFLGLADAPSAQE